MESTGVFQILPAGSMVQEPMEGPCAYIAPEIRSASKECRIKRKGMRAPETSISTTVNILMLSTGQQWHRGSYASILEIIREPTVLDWPFPTGRELVISRRLM